MAELLRRLELAQLRAFCVAIELGSLGKAAQLLRVSQPALSKRMRELELVAGTPLLTRSPRGVTPTAAGARLYAEARPLLTQAEHVEEVMEGLRDVRAPIRLAAGHTIAEYLLPEPLSEYRARLGQRLALELVVANSSVVHDLVREGRADFGLAAIDPHAIPDALLVSQHVCEDEVLAAVSPAHPWAAHARVPAEEFLRTPMVMRDPSANTRRIVDAVLHERGLRLAAPLTEVGSTSAAIAAALSGDAPALLSGLAIGPGDGRLIGCRIEGLRFIRRFALLWRARDPLDPQVRTLVDYLSRSLHEGSREP
jgi:DNA-binding transcriptional LysR family regulator